MNDTKPIAAQAGDPQTDALRDGIEQTRAGMSATIEALETRLNPQELRGKVEVELQHVETKVREVVREHLSEAKALVREELGEAKTLLHAELASVETKLKEGLSDARDTVKEDLQEAVAGAKRALRAATVGKVEDLATHLGDAMNDTRDTLIETVRQNPLPAALAGLGLAWLLMNRSSSAKRSRFGSGGPSGYAPPSDGGGYLGRGSSGIGVDRALHDAGSAASRTADPMGSVIRGAVSGAADTVGHLAHQASDAATGVAHDASDFVGQVASQTASAGSALLHGAADASTALVHGAGDVATYVGDHAMIGARRVEKGLEKTLQQSPLALGVAALAAGAAVGFSLPRTHGEDELMGETRDRVIRRAGSAAHDAAAAVGHLTEKTAESAKQALESTAGARTS